MKRLFIVLLFLLATLSFESASFADTSTTTTAVTSVCGKTYQTAISGDIITFDFSWGAFGPGCMGTMNIYQTINSVETLIASYQYSQPDGEALVSVPGFGAFYQTGSDTLKYMVSTHYELSPGQK